MSRVEFEELYIEVTQRCNMDCDHCLRGDGDGRDLNPEILRPLLSKTDRIRLIGFTGGEPSLVPEILEGILSLVKEYQIPVENFYLVTNGKVVSDAFLSAVLHWQSYCIRFGMEPELSGLALSKDEFHEEIPPENEAKLRMFSFFTEDKMVSFLDTNRPKILDMGRASELYANSGYTRELVHFDPVIDVEGDTVCFREGSLLATTDGKLLSECNVSYDRADEFLLCPVSELETYLEQVIEEKGE